MDGNNITNDNDRKKISFVAVAILILMITTTGSTYAYLALSVNAVNNISGTVATAGLNFQLANNATTTSGIPSLAKPSSTYASSPMVPQLAYKSSTNILQKAVTANCVDGNTNVVCRIYTFTVRNNSTANVKINGRVYFSSAPTNLRWALMSNATTVSVTGTTAATNFRTPQTSSQCTVSTSTTGTNANNCWFEVDKTLVPSGGASSTNAASGSYQQYWLVFWINETEAVQNDSGTWYATVEFTSSNGTGITSTINS